MLIDKLKTKTVEQSSDVKFFSLTRLPPRPESHNVFAIAINIARTPIAPNSFGVKKCASKILVKRYMPCGTNFSMRPNM